MMLNDLVRSCTWPQLEPTFIRLYPDEAASREGYAHVFEELKSVAPRSTGMRILIREEVGIDGDRFHDVSGRDGTLRTWTLSAASVLDESDSEEERFALEYEDWDVWLGMTVSPDAAERYSSEEIVAHCLYEMTFFGFSREAVRAWRRRMESEAANASKEMRRRRSNEDDGQA